MTVSERPGGPLAAPIYLDSSALAKLYLPEPGSDILNGMLEGRDDLVISDLAVTEVVSALARRRREGQIDAGFVRRVQREILQHVAAGVYRSVELAATIHREAERLLLHLARVPLRAADALHLALALGSGARAVATYDQRMGDAARALSLALVPDPAPGPHPSPGRMRR
jgi:predicted nucleic acid-binding protein